MDNKKLSGDISHIESINKIILQYFYVTIKSISHTTFSFTE